ncbi:hypothetical protein ACJIZ3_024050 [Penstemon smallii]|uniref:Glycoside hydrolase family 19 catalytic domain-containing protein n=1 Tax=Penstemon smallii TaxID=265156 RepID=A0ABD3TQQ9_9LAMI
MGFLLSEKRKYYVFVLIMILITTITPILCYNINGGVLVKDIVTDTFFNEVANRADIVSKCKGNCGFFNRSVFLGALDSFPQFGTVGSKDDSAREIAAFFAHVTHDAADIFSDDDQVGLVRESKAPAICYGTNVGWYACDPDPVGPDWNSRPSSPISSSLNNNHDTISDQSIENIDININELVQHRSSSVILLLFKRLLGFWMNNCHNAITSGQGFGATIRAITTSTSGECDGLNPTAIISRVQLYTNYCNILRVHPGKNLNC